MHPDYSEADTEHARASERSSAGINTQRLAPTNHSAPAAPRWRNNNAALVLVVVGMLLLAGQLWGGIGNAVPWLHAPGSDEITAGIILLTIASCLLFFSFWRHIYGLLIPGCILVGLSVGVPLASFTDGISVLWGLALAFVTILVVGRGLFKIDSIWPVFPAVALFAVGAIIAVVNLPLIFVGGFIWLPLLLIVLGLFLGWGRGQQQRVS